MKSSSFILLLMAAAFFTACSKDDGPASEEPGEDTPQEGAFVVAGPPQLGQSDVLFASATLDEGELSTTGTGIEQLGANRNYLVHEKSGIFFSLLFGQASAGAVTAYKMNANKELQKISDFQTETMTASGVVGDDILLIKNAWQPEESITRWYRVSTESLQIVAQGEIDANALAQTGEKAFFTSIQQVGDKVYAPFWKIESARSFSSEHARDSLFVAVYSYPAMQLEKVIKDNRTGAAGAFFASGIEVDENEDVYVIGTKLTPNSQNQFSTNTPVAFTKIKKGTTEFDKTYFFNITAASGGQYIFRKLYLGKGNFLLTMSDRAERYGTTMSFTGGIRFAIANVYEASFKWVTGTPDAIYRTTEYSHNYSPLDGKTGYIGINVLDMTTFTSKAAIYKFDAETATATEGLTLGGGYGVASINWVPISK